MKTFTTILTTALSALVLATACDEPVPEAVKVSGVTLDRETLLLTLTVGETPTAILKAAVAPADAANQVVTWESDDNAVATIDGGGKVTAVSAGEAVITVTTDDGNKEDVCTVTVVDNTENHGDRDNLLNAEHIPDAMFLDYCNGQMTVWDTDENGGLSLDEAKAVTNMNITDINTIGSLKGIEHFTGLQTLECRNLGALAMIDVSGCTALTSLIVFGCTALTSLNAEGNRLTALEVSDCTALQTLYCNGNALTSTSLKISGCMALESLDVSNNELISLDVSGYTALTDLKCSYNRLTLLHISTTLKYLACANNRLSSLAVSECAALEYLNCHTNMLGSLDVSKCAALTDLDCYNNLLSSLDISNCVLLDYLDCYGNKLTKLDVSQNAALAILSCGYNLLTALDLAGNGKLESFSCIENQLSELTVGAEYKVLNDFDCQNNSLSAEQLNDIFRTLPDTGPEGPTRIIAISGNPGASACDTGIAVAKNWKVENRSPSAVATRATAARRLRAL